MLRHLLFYFLLLTFIVTKGQTDFKKQETFSFNVVSGFQSFTRTDDLNQKLISNNFSSVSTPHLAIGFEFAVVSNQSLLKFQMRGTGLFVKQNVQNTTLQTASLSLEYGYDILKKHNATYIYPFIGIRLFDNSLIGKSLDGKKLNTYKDIYEITFGFGAKHFLNSSLEGLFNNVDLNFGASLPVINGKWGKEGSEYVAGTYKLKSTYFVTFTIGRGFRPSSIQ